MPSDGLPRYLVDWYRPGVGEDLLEQMSAKLEARAERSTVEGVPVRLLLTLSAPADEVVFGVFTAGSAESVARICRQAGLPTDRVVEVIERPGTAGVWEHPHAQA
jgi:hypothetical protein